jgi:hypothetical protein
MARSLHVYALLAALLLCAATTAIAADEHFFPSNLMRPPSGVYTSQDMMYWSYYYNLGLRNIAVSHPTASFLPPALGLSETHTFDVMVSAEMSLDNGLNWLPFAAPATETINSFHSSDAGGLSYFNEEIYSLDIRGNTPYGPMMIRESPTMPSLGQATIEPDSGGYQISSFFDVFTELSLDGGQTWAPATTGYVHIELVPEPSAFFALFAGIAGLAGFRRFRR